MYKHTLKFFIGSFKQILMWHVQSDRYCICLYIFPSCADAYNTYRSYWINRCPSICTCMYMSPSGFCSFSSRSMLLFTFCLCLCFSHSLSYPLTILHYLNSFNVLFSQILLFHTKFQLQREKVQERASKIAQWIKTLTAEPDDVSSLTWWKKNWLLWVYFWSDCLHRQTNTIYKRKFKGGEEKCKKTDFLDIIRRMHNSTVSIQVSPCQMSVLSILLICYILTCIHNSKITYTLLL